MNLNKYTTILIALCLAYFQFEARAEIVRRTEPGRAKIFQKIGPFVGLIPGIVAGSSVGAFKVIRASSEALAKTLKNDRINHRKMLCELPAASIAFSIGLLTGMTQGGVYGGYAGLLLGAGYGIRMDKSLHNLIKRIRKEKGTLWAENLEQKNLEKSFTN